ncbi:MAG: VTT domain-containing protein [Prosthecobacter sp.]|nr:VTT domain-containing protein [Prosthecobacter sp.]
MTDPQEPLPSTSPLPGTGTTEENSLESQASRSRQKDNRRVLILALGVALFMAAAHFTPLKAWITNVQTWKDYVRTLGGAAHAWFVLACAGAVCIGVPRLPLCAVAGLVFGFGEGLVLSLLGSTTGSYGAFLMARHGARRAFLARAQRWPWLADLLRQPSLMRVFWVRQLMLPGMVLNVMLGVTHVRHRVFLAGTLLGYLPLNAAFSLVGSGLGKGSLAQTLVQLLAAMGVVNLAGWLVWRWVQRNRASAPQ